MRNRLILLAGCLCLFGASAMAETNIRSTPNDSLQVISRKAWGDMITKPNANGIGEAILSDHEDFFLEVCLRVKTGDAEQHNHWNDYFVVTEGDAKLLTAKADPAAPANASGEVHPKNLEGTGAASLDVHPGDVVIIPAGLVHQVVLNPGTKEFRYLVFKKRV